MSRVVTVAALLVLLAAGTAFVVPVRGWSTPPCWAGHGGDKSCSTTGTTATDTTTTTAPTSTATTTTTVAPTLVSSDPSDGATVSGTVTWTVQTDGDVAQVEFWADGVKLGTDATAPWSFQLDTTQFTDGAHKFGLALISSEGTRYTPQVGTFTIANGAPAPQAGTVYFRGDYETGDFSQWHGPQLCQNNPSLCGTGAGATSATVETSVVRQGRYAAAYTVPASTVRERAQVYADQAQTDGYDGQEVWYAWSIYVKPGSTFEQNSAWNNLTSFHQTGPSCQAPDHLEVDNRNGLNNELYWRASGGTLSSTCGVPSSADWHFGTIQQGRWYDFVVHVKWSSDPSVGFVEMFIDGQRATPLTHVATLYAGQGVYWKQGFDTGGSGAVTIYEDGNVAASDYADAVTAFPAGAWPSTPPS